LDDVNNLMCGLGTDVGNLLGTLAARFKRGLPNEVFKLKSERANLVTGSLSTAGLSASLNLGVDADEDVSLELGGKVSLHAISCCIDVLRLTRFIPGEKITRRRE
jgi:hypothetical protein